MSTALLARMSSLVHGSNVPSELQSVVEHLSLLFNTRRGSCSSDKRLGMADFTDALHDFPSGILTLQRMIADLLQRYEPRLHSVSVRPLRQATTQLGVSFDIRAQMRGSRVQFQVEISHNGLVVIS